MNGIAWVDNTDAKKSHYSRWSSDELSRNLIDVVEVVTASSGARNNSKRCYSHHGAQ